MHRKTDSEIEQWVLRELMVSKKVHSPEICVLARDGVVSLRGSARSFEDRSAVEEATRRATGVVAVMNELRVKPHTHLLRDEVHPTSKDNALSRSYQDNKDGRLILTTI